MRGYVVGERYEGLKFVKQPHCKDKGVGAVLSGSLYLDLFEYVFHNVLWGELKECMDELTAAFGPHGELRGVGGACCSCVDAGDGLGVAFVLVLGIEQPLPVLLVLHAFLVELAV